MFDISSTSWTLFLHIGHFERREPNVKHINWDFHQNTKHNRCRAESGWARAHVLLQINYLLISGYEFGSLIRHRPRNIKIIRQHSKILLHSWYYLHDRQELWSGYCRIRHLFINRWVILISYCLKIKMRAYKWRCLNGLHGYWGYWSIRLL